MSLREQAAHAIADALRAEPSADAYPLAYQVMRGTGLRRALWAALSIDARKALVKRAQRLAREESHNEPRP